LPGNRNKNWIDDLTAASLQALRTQGSLEHLEEGCQYKFLIVNPLDSLLLIPEATLFHSLNELSISIKGGFVDATSPL
jgi:hypothetical protein